jgi:hypothetical protein
VLQEDQLIQMLYTNPTPLSTKQSVENLWHILRESRYRSGIFLPSDGCSRKWWWAEPISPNNAYQIGLVFAVNHSVWESPIRNGKTLHRRG